MQKETPTLQAQRRERLGTRYARRLRLAGRLPAVIYGHKTDPLSVSLDEKQVLTTLKQGVHVLNVAIDGGATETCLIKDLQFGFLGDNVVHVDLARVDLDEVVEVKVHLNYYGLPEAAKKPGTIMVHDLTELEVSCKVRDIPGDIRVDLTKMGEDYFAKDVTLPAGVTLAIPAETIISHIEVVKEEIEETGEAAVTDAAAEPEVLTARKDKEGEGDAKDAKEGKEKEKDKA